MKKSVLLALALLLTIPAYMAFIISRSEKSPDKILYKYYYPDINTFSVEPNLSVWLAQSDTNYIECLGCDTAGMFSSKKLSLKTHPGGYYFSNVKNEDMHYKLGLKALGSLVAERNIFYISGYKQSKLWVTLGANSEISIENCELDTLFVSLNSWGLEDLKLLGNCRIKHISIESMNEMSSLLLSCSRDVVIESLEATNMDKDNLIISVSADILAAMNFTLNGRQVTKPATDSTATKLRK